jgi:hypothetical protein
MPTLSESAVFSKIATGQALTEVNLSNCGLTEFPKILFKLKDSLEVLNLGGNRLSTLPPAMTSFSKLRILFFAGNDFETIPECLGALPSLYMLSFKGNKVHTVPANSLSPSLGWLILTDNNITELPDTIGNLHGLRKCMLANNKLQGLPSSMSKCKNLELLRLSRNSISQLPSFLLTMSKLSWLSIAGNCMWTEHSGSEQSSFLTVTTNNLCISSKIGEGASGLVYDATWSEDYGLKESAPVGADGSSFAYKIFRGQCTSDGHPEDEMKNCIAAGYHVNIMSAAASVVDPDSSNADSGMVGLLFPLIPSNYAGLGNPPSFETVTRDVYPPCTMFRPQFILRVVMGIASAMRHLHARGIIHGDLYAHNIHVDEEGNPLLMDFGASFRHPDVSSQEFHALQRIEVRAFGCLLEDLIQKVPAMESSSDRQEYLSATLMVLCGSCIDADIDARPCFESICNSLSQFV